MAFSLPFFVDAATFAVSAVLVSLIPRPSPPEHAKPDVHVSSWKADIAEGFRWLWSHDLLRPMAVILGCLNALFILGFSILVLFSQEVLSTSPTEFAILNMSGVLGGIVGGWTASRIAKRLGPGPSLILTLATGAATHAGIAFTSDWPVVFVLMAAFSLTGMLWNIITVIFRQEIIPDGLLGRVNSVYRFFAWAMMPLGSLAGGLIELGAETFVSRESALRTAWP